MDPILTIKKHIVKELSSQGWDTCDINQVLDNYSIRLERAASEEEKQEILKEIKDDYNYETASL